MMRRMTRRALLACVFRWIWPWQMTGFCTLGIPSCWCTSEEGKIGTWLWTSTRTSTAWLRLPSPASRAPAGWLRDGLRPARAPPSSSPGSHADTWQTTRVHRTGRLWNWCGCSVDGSPEGSALCYNQSFALKTTGFAAGVSKPRRLELDITVTDAIIRLQWKKKVNLLLFIFIIFPN